jgi:transposase
MAGFFWFSDDQWSRIEPLLPVNAKGARRVDDRRVLSGIVHALQSGGRWGDCPPVDGHKQTLDNHFMRWAERGVWQDIFSALAGAKGAPDRLLVDSTCIKAHRTAGGAKGGAMAIRIGQTPVGETPRSMPSATWKAALGC